MTMNSARKVRIAAYLRVSTDEQAKTGFGLDTQIRHIKSEVERYKDKGWVLDKKMIYKDDGYSGSLAKRPALNRLLRDAKAKKFDILLTWKIDRLYRNTRLLLETMDMLGDYEIDYKSITEPFDTTAVGKFIFQMFGALAEFERNLILTRTSEGKISSAKEGNFVGGNIPYGYTTVDKKLTVLPDEAKIVRKVFVWFVELDYTVTKIAEKLTTLRVPGKHDKKGKSKRRKNPENFWHQSTIENMLKRTEYIGIYYYNKTGKNKNGERIIKPKEEWISFGCPSIVDKAIFHKAQEKFKETKKRSNNVQTKYLFSSKIRCGLCSSTFTGYKSAKGTKNYRCGKNNKTKASVKCRASQISEKKLIDLLWEGKLLPFLKQPARELNKLIKEQNQDSYYQSLVEDKALLEKRKRANQNARIRVKEAYRRGVYTPDELEEEISLVEKEYQEIEEELIAINAQLTTEDEKQEKINSVKEMANKYKKELKTITYDSMYAVIQALVKRITIKGDDITVELQIPKIEQKNTNKLKGVYGSAKGNRTPVSAVRGRRPNP